MKKLLLLSFLFLYFHVNICAQWVQTKGPFGGDVNSITTVGDSVIYAGVGVGGIFISKDKGKNWKNLVNTNSVYQIKVNGNIIYALTTSGLLFSKNNGIAWSIANLGTAPGTINSIDLMDNKIFVATSKGLFVSADTAKTWKSKENLLIKDKDNYFIFASGTKLFVASSNNGVTINGAYVSNDQGENWSKVATEIGNVIYAMAKDQNSLVISSSNGVFLSNNNGDTWKNISTIYNSSVAIRNNIIYAIVPKGIAMTSNEGATWETIKEHNDHSYFRDLAVSGNALYVASINGGGVSVTSDNGKNWQQDNIGMINTFVWTMEQIDNQIYAGTFGGLFLSKNQGNSWVLIKNGLPAKNVYTVKKISKRIFAGTTDGIFISDDNGLTWSASNSGLPTNSTFVKHILQTTQGNLLIGTGNGAFLSKDNGATWKSASVGLATGVINFMVSDGKYIYAATNNKGLYRTENEGTTWVASNTGISTTSVRSCAFSEKNLFAATNLGFYRSKISDNGTNWKQVLPSSISSYACMVIGNKVFVTTVQGIFQSSDEGETWTTVNVGLQNIITLSLLYANDPISGQYLFAGTSSKGVWKADASKFGIVSDNDIFLAKESNINIYPNPTFDEINIEIQNETTPNHYIIFNSIGQKVQEGILQEQPNRNISVAHLPKGSYYVYFLEKNISKIFVKN
jgi:photosystem II stability/assembly factor-like uncharacterized protein